MDDTINQVIPVRERYHFIRVTHICLGPDPRAAFLGVLVKSVRIWPFSLSRV